MRNLSSKGGCEGEKIHIVSAILLETTQEEGTGRMNIGLASRQLCHPVPSRASYVSSEKVLHPSSLPFCYIYGS